MSGSRSATYLAQLVFASISGYLLVRLVSFLWGTGEQAGSFEIAWSIPMFLITASGLNVIQAVTARFFSKLLESDSATVSEYLSSFLNLFAALLIPMILFVAWFRHDLAAIAGPGLSSSMQAQTADLIVVLAPLAGLFGFGLFFGGVYAAYGKPVTAELVLLLTRILAVSIVSLVLLAGFDVSTYFLAITLLASALISTGYVYRLARKHLGFRYRLTWKHVPEILRSVGTQSLLFLLVAVLGQGIIIYYRSVLSDLDLNLIAAFSYALLVTYTFSNIVGKLSFFDMTLPTQAAFEANDFVRYKATIAKSAAAYGLASVAVAILLAWNSSFVISLLFGGGQFDEQSLASVKRVFDILIFSVPATTLLWVLRVPGITGPSRHALPISEILIWLGLLLAVQVQGVSSNPELLIALLTGSYWLRVILAAFIVGAQVKNQRRLSTEAG